MKIVIDIPDEQVKKSLEESKYIHEDEGEKGFVHISMLYTNAQLEFVCVERKTDFYSCEYKILPKGHGRKFEEIVVEYPPADLCIYPEYRGKPYFSIKYEENGEHIIGFGTYSPKVFSKYLQEYFITPTTIKADKTESEEKKNENSI